MATFGQITSAVQGNLRQERADLTVRIKTAINDAVRYYQPEKLWFQQAKLQITLTTGNAVVPSIPSDFNNDEFNSLSIVDGAYVYNLQKISVSEYDAFDLNNSGIPIYYTYDNNVLKVYPIPDKAYVINLRYFKKYVDLVNDGDTNDWTDNASKLIESKATSYLWLDVSGSPDGQAIYDSRCADELNQLRRTTNNKRKTGTIKPYGVNYNNFSNNFYQ